MRRDTRRKWNDEEEKSDANQTKIYLQKEKKKKHTIFPKKWNERQETPKIVEPFHLYIYVYNNQIKSSFANNSGGKIAKRYIKD